MIGISHRVGMGLRRVLWQAFLLLMTTALVLGAAGLEANEYGEIDEIPEAEPSGEEKTPPAAAVDGEALVPEPPAPGVEPGEVEPEAYSSSEEEKETAEAVVYVFNRDDDALSISLLIDSELMGTEEVPKEKEKKFGSYEMAAGDHDFRISWWDDDTKKTHQEDLTVALEGTTAVTLYATQNKGPEEFEVNVMLKNDNDEDLEAYLYVDGLYEKLKTAKKKSTTDFGKFDLEEGTHVLAVRWQDPVTKIEYEKRKTIRVSGKEAVTFYAPAGMTFERVEGAAASPKAAGPPSPSKTASETPPMGEVVEGPTSPDGADPKMAVQDSREKGGDAGRMEAVVGGEAKGTGSEGPDQEAASNSAGSKMVIPAAGAILAIYIVFFRR